MSLKLNLGCGSNLLEGYVNIDQDDINVMKERYPNKSFPEDLTIYTFNMFNLPYKANSVDEILADGFIEHLSFIEEKKLFYEIVRVLRPGGILNFSVPNFEKLVKVWLEAEDNWKDFYREDSQDHWFGQNKIDLVNRWGYLTAALFGSQKGEGQYHQNCYTIPKIKSILVKLGFTDIKITEYSWRGDRDPMIRAVSVKL